ncbi:MAG: 50S ribosomal protein L3 [Candidatus Omnitrophica bacterium]|nr:50S ribosomal protein L3 [Candidatus Omnitrophota bacterium]MDD5080735.1 50S ribosomal protein L3 [Candidatus Omnitrophota bacterium]MDD5440699.1 50S ribosomal protein L3 [Candidatus Omnitrophota bacterium]
MIREILGKKIGMTQVFDDNGDIHGVTVIEIEPACILEKVEYPSKIRARIGCFKVMDARVSKVAKPQKGYFDKLGVSPYKVIREVEIDDATDFSFLNKTTADIKNDKVSEQADKVSAEGQEAVEVNAQEQTAVKDDLRYIGVELFKEGDIVDVRAKTKGRGFAGGMKRHGWAGQPGGHGSTTHRRIGAAGQCADPSKIMKGLHMPGHMGNVYRIAKKLQVLTVDTENNVIIIKGSIPGHNGCVVKIKKMS